jgi:hypothetical protein
MEWRFRRRALRKFLGLSRIRRTWRHKAGGWRSDKTWKQKPYWIRRSENHQVGEEYNIVDIELLHSVAKKCTGVLLCYLASRLTRFGCPSIKQAYSWLSNIWGEAVECNYLMAIEIMLDVQLYVKMCRRSALEEKSTFGDGNLQST